MCFFFLDNIVADHIYSAIFDSFKFAMESWYRDCGWPAETFQMPIKVILRCLKLHNIGLMLLVKNCWALCTFRMM